MTDWAWADASMGVVYWTIQVIIEKAAILERKEGVSAAFYAGCCIIYTKSGAVFKYFGRVSSRNILSVGLLK